MANGNGYRFREKVLDPGQRVTIFEYIPPEVGTGDEDLRRSAAALVKATTGFEVDGLYFPHVIDESREGAGPRVWRPERVAPRDFARHVRAYNRERGEEHDQRVALIVSETFAYHPRANVESWIVDTARERHIGNIVVVGKSYSDDAVTGYEVPEALRRIGEMNASGAVNVFPGAIAIAGRPEEAERMLAKTLAGAKYFTTQLFYSAGSMVRLLREYTEACERESVAPARVFLATAPVPTPQTAELIEKFLRRPIEADVKRAIFDAAEGRYKRRSGSGNDSVRQIEAMFHEIFEAVYGEGLCPVGVCVEHVSDGNFRNAFDLLHSLPDLWKGYLPDQAPRARV